MSDFLGPLLGMSPYNGLGGFGRAMPQMTPATQAQVAAAEAVANSRLAQVSPIVGPPVFWYETPLPEHGIHWTRTGGKSWRVEIVR